MCILTNQRECVEKCVLEGVLLALYWSDTLYHTKHKCLLQSTDKASRLELNIYAKLSICSYKKM